MPTYIAQISAWARTATASPCARRSRSAPPAICRSSTLTRLAIAALAGQIPSCKLRTLWSTRIKAVGYKKSLSIDAADALIDFETAKPAPAGRDIRATVKALAAHPVDYEGRELS